jgi:pyruvate kinase
LFRGVYPIYFNEKGIHDHAILNRAIVEQFLQRGLAEPEDRIILTKGDLTGASGGTNAMKIASVNEVLAAAPEDWKEHCPGCE